MINNRNQFGKVILKIVLYLLMVTFSSMYAYALPAKNLIVIQDEMNSNLAYPTKFYNGSDYVDDEVFGEVIKTNSAGYVAKEINNKISAKEGTISIWIKPTWDAQNKDSHTFLSMSWNHPKKSYMALSYGWWEPLGKNRLYFIISNQEFINCQTPYNFDLNEWHFITITWKSGQPGYCKLFVDGAKAAENKMKFSGNYTSKDLIYIGSDKGTTENKNRAAGSLSHLLNIYKVAVSDADVKQLYKNESVNESYAEQKKLKWMDESVQNNSELQYSNDGAMLENRVMFDEDIGWAYSKENSDKILEKIKEAGFNVYIPCVWHGKGTYYPTELSKMDARIKRNDDPLLYLLTKAHQLGIEVHPWFTVVRREDNSLSKFFDSGTPEYAFNVHNKEFREFIVALMVDVVRKYPVDGINLDYIRSMGFCESQSCADDYNFKFGRNLYTDLVLRKIPGYNVASLIEWNTASITNIVTNFSNAAKLIKPKLIISIDGHPLHDDLIIQGQDSISWANNQLIDVIFNMDYKEKIDYQKINEIRAKLNQPEKLITLLSLFDRVDGIPVKRSPEMINKYIEYLRKNWPNTGVAFYHFPQLSDAVISKLKTESFTNGATTKWLTN